MIIARITTISGKVYFANDSVIEKFINNDTGRPCVWYRQIKGNKIIAEINPRYVESVDYLSGDVVNIQTVNAQEPKKIAGGEL